jgi:hypothetical protein
MTVEDFSNRKWRHSESIDYKPPSLEGVVISCMLLAIDFEECLFKLTPFDTEMYEEQSFWCRVENCERSPHKLKIKK